MTYSQVWHVSVTDIRMCGKTYTLHESLLSPHVLHTCPIRSSVQAPVFLHFWALPHSFVTVVPGYYSAAHLLVSTSAAVIH